MDQSIFLLFLFAISLHNIEEAIWLPSWSKHAKHFHKQVEKYEFYFAVIIITILAFLSTALFIIFPECVIIKYVYFGFLGAMIINVFVPHLAATILLKKYAPGLITGLLLILPVNILTICISLQNDVITIWSLVVSTVVVGIILLIILPQLFKLAHITLKAFHN